MKFIVAALMGAVQLSDMILGKGVTRAACEGGPYVPDATRRLLEDVAGVSRLMQKDGRSLRVWSNWINVADGEYTLSLYDGSTCNGDEGSALDNQRSESEVAGEISIRGDFGSSEDLASLINAGTSMGLKDADGNLIGCCSIVEEEKSESEDSMSTADEGGDVRRMEDEVSE